MKILVTGAAGLVGSALASRLAAAGHSVTPLSRKAGASGPTWNPEKDELDPEALAGFDAVAHLAGESIQGHWNAAKKQRIRDSRVAGTRLLAEAIAHCSRPPRTLVCASAIGYYGSRGEELLNENSAPGADFLADVCQEWEQASEPAAAANTRVARARIGVVVSARGGALPKMLTPFRLGLGGVVGSGRQYWSWVSIDDVCGAFLHLLERDDLSGAFNLTAPQPPTNREFTKALGKALGRPTLFPLPAFMVRLMLGEMGEALLLSSTRVDSGRLAASGYTFRHPDLEPAVRELLGAKR